MQRILLVDDHPIFRQEIRDVLATEYPRACFGEASNGQEALELIFSQSWDLILLDVSMPVLDGFEVLEEMRRRHIKMPVVMLSVHPESQFGEWALRAGAASYVTKQNAPRVLLEVVGRFLLPTPDAGMG